MKVKQGLYWVGLVLFTVLLDGCGASATSPSTQSNSSLVGTWQLQDISCDGQQSTVLPDSTLGNASNGVSSSLVFGNSTGQRIWIIGSCTISVPFTYSYVAGSNNLQVSASPAQCSGSCSGFSDCSENSSYPGQNYPIQLSQPNTLAMTIPPAILALDNDPCGSNQGTNDVIFNYQKQ